MSKAESSSPLTLEIARGSRAIAAARTHFRKLRDPRLRKGKRHRLVDTVLITLLGVLCDCDDADEIADWAELNQPWLSQWFELEHGTPSQDTILRVFAALRPKTFAQALMSWLSSLRAAGTRQIAIDGKSLRGSLTATKGIKAVHVISAWFREAGLCLGQVKSKDGSNEITAIPELLRLLDLEGCTVSVDAGGCHRAIAQQIVEQKGDYLLAVKDNQPTLRQDLERLFKEAKDSRRRSQDELARPATTSAKDADGGHGRIDERRVYLCHDLDWLSTREQWQGLWGAVMVESSRTNLQTGKQSSEKRYYITSNSKMTASQALEFTRGHWSVENNLHWVLDVSFAEDASRIRTRNAGENFALVRRLALSLLNSTPPPKKAMSIKRRRHYCAHSHDYLQSVLDATASRS